MKGKKIACAMMFLAYGSFYAVKNPIHQAGTADKSLLTQMGSTLMKEAASEVEAEAELLLTNAAHSTSSHQSKPAVRTAWVDSNNHIALNVAQAAAFDSASQVHSDLSLQILTTAILANPTAFGYTGSSQSDMDAFIQAASAARTFKA